MPEPADYLPSVAVAEKDLLQQGPQAALMMYLEQNS